ncbi:rifin, partial [Plasmodium reichenowi]
QNDAIPTCVCEKSLEDKVEKECLKCAQNLGGIVAPSSGVLAGISEGAISAWQTTKIAAATQEAIAKGALVGEAARIPAGVDAVIDGLNALKIEELGIVSWKPYFSEGYCIKVKELATVILKKRDMICGTSSTLGEDTCKQINISIGTMQANGQPAAPGPGPIETVLNGIVEGAEKTAETEAAKVTSTTTTNIITEKTGEINATCAACHSTIIASIVAIVVIVLIMVIMYLILRYRRKKKMKKKLQYIKLLEE